jgi:hypothetical protein
MIPKEVAPAVFPRDLINSGENHSLLERALSDSGGKKPRLFDGPECKGSVFKGGRYCWNECPYNVWRKY